MGFSVVKLVSVSRQPLIVSSIVWGGQYVQNYLNFALPSLLAGQNLVAVARQRDVRLVIATTRRDWQTLSQHSAIRFAEKQFSVEFKLFEVKPKHERFHMTEGQIFGLRAAVDAKALWSYCLADQIWSDGALSAVVDRLIQHRAVMSHGHRMTDVGLLDELGRFKNRDVLSIDSQAFARLMLKYPHEEIRLCEVTDTTVPGKPNIFITYSRARTAAVVRDHSLAIVGVNFERVPIGDAESYLARLSGSTSDDTGTYRQLVGDLSEVYFSQSTEEFATSSFQGPIDYRHRRTIRFPQGDAQQALLTCVRDYQQNEWVDVYSRYFATRPYLIAPSNDPEFCRRNVEETQELFVRAATILWSQSPAASRKPRRFRPLFLLPRWHPRRVAMGAYHRLVRATGLVAKKPRD